MATIVEYDRFLYVVFRSMTSILHLVSAPNAFPRSSILGKHRENSGVYVLLRCRKVEPGSGDATTVALKKCTER